MEIGHILRRAVGLAARRMPLESPLGCTAASLLFLFGLGWLLPRLGPAMAPVLGAIPGAFAVLLWASRAAALAGLVGLALFQARCLWLCYPDYFSPGQSPRAGRRRAPAAFRLAGMPIAHEDLRTSILVTGVTGSSKTAGILLPLLAELFAAYDGRSREALGAFIPEVKGDLVDAAIYLAHEAGRCVSRDVIVLSPSCRVPVVRYRDEHGRCWYVSARGGAGGSEAAALFPALTFPAGHPCEGRAASPFDLEEPADAAALLPLWSEHPLSLGSRRPRFIGWRWESDGRLWRVSHTERREGPEALLHHGRRQWADPPRTLRAEAIEYVDNGIHYNLVDPRLPAAEAAERLTKLAAMTRGSASRGENDYFYDQGRKLLSACLSLHRAVERRPPTLADLVRLATQDGPLEEALGRLEDMSADETRRDLAAYFRSEWLRMVAEGKTATVVRSTLSAAFDLFLHDPHLSETFCRPSTFSFEDIARQGRIIGFVPGARYEQIGRILGAACKLDFQSAMLARTSRPEMNATRLAVYAADECHKYAIGGSASAGDPFFMNLSRSNQVVNLCATQSYAWLVDVLGREAADVYLSAFGIQFWLQQTDPETCRRAAEICGLTTRERTATEHDLNLGGMIGALGSGRELSFRRRRQEEETHRFRPEDFALLDVGEAIAYNKGRPGRSAKACRGRVRYLECTRPPHGPAAVNARANEYYREILENQAHARGAEDQWEAVALDGAAEFASYVGERPAFL